MSFIEQMITAIYRFQSYPKLIVLKAGKVIGYLFIFTVIIGIVTALPYAVKYFKMGGIAGAVEKYVPEFSIENGKLECETIDYTDDMSGIKIYVDNNEDAESINTDNYYFYIIADSDKMVMGNNVQREVVSFSDIDGTINKDMMVSFFGSKKVQLAIITIFSITALFSMCVSAIFGLLFLSLIAVLINICVTRAGIGYGDILKLTVYARTFPAILVLVIGMCGFGYGQLLFLGLFITYTYLGLKNIKKQEAVIIAEI